MQEFDFHFFSHLVSRQLIVLKKHSLFKRTFKCRQQTPPHAPSDQRDMNYGPLAR